MFNQKNVRRSKAILAIASGLYFSPLIGDLASNISFPISSESVGIFSECNNDESLQDLEKDIASMRYFRRLREVRDSGNTNELVRLLRQITGYEGKN